VKESEAMEYDKYGVDAMVLALLYLTSTHDTSATRAWKGTDWEAMDRVYNKGDMSDPKGTAVSVVLTDAGAQLSRELFFTHCGAKEESSAPNNWLNLTAGALRVFKFCSPYSRFLVNQSLCTATCGRLAKPLCSATELSFTDMPFQSEVLLSYG